MGGEFAIGHTISIPERFRSYRKLHGNINYCDQCDHLLVKQICFITIISSCQADRSLGTIMMLYLRISRDSARNNEA